MAREFDIPNFYRSSGITQIKSARNVSDPRKKDFSPTTIDLGVVRFKIARHFGFCFGVQNAIEIAYKALEENPGKRIFLLSEMIHNPHVNEDLRTRGIQFLRTTEGEELISFDELNPDDVVIMPAFGTTVEIFQKLSELGINPYSYNTTCPFVEKVWKRSNQLGAKGYSIVVHGKYKHEETRATFSHAYQKAPTVVIRDMEEALVLKDYIQKKRPAKQFYTDFKDLHSPGFDAEKDLNRIGVVNQTTMLATETQEISQMLREAMKDFYGEEVLNNHFADTRDTLCYATSENQQSVYAMIESGGDVALIVGGYNSSNTSHLVELCAQSMPAFHIKDAAEILSSEEIRHLDYKRSEVVTSKNWLPVDKKPLDILITAGASCPDALVDLVLKKVAALFNLEEKIAESYSFAA